MFESYGTTPKSFRAIENRFYAVFDGKVEPRPSGLWEAGRKFAPCAPTTTLWYPQVPLHASPSTLVSSSICSRDRRRQICCVVGGDVPTMVVGLKSESPQSFFDDGGLDSNHAKGPD
jgi:hypothetical protein